VARVDGPDSKCRQRIFFKIIWNRRIIDPISVQHFVSELVATSIRSDRKNHDLAQRNTALKFGVSFGRLLEGSTNIVHEVWTRAAL